MALLAVACLIVADDTPRARCDEPEHPLRTLSADNGIVRVSIDRRDGRLLELVDLGSAHNHAGECEPRGGLWRIGFVDGAGRKAGLEPADAKDFRCEPLPAESGLRLIWSRFERPGFSECEVDATIRLRDGDPNSRWGISVRLPEGFGVEEIAFPRVQGIRRQEDERLAVPLWMGHLLPNPRDHLAGPDGKGTALWWEYPGFLSLQCIAYYADQGNGLYVACEDPGVARKRFVIAGAPGGEVDFTVAHQPADPAAQETRYVLPYEALLGVFQGDWITAAERYREWGTRQFWAKESRLNRGLVPRWVLDTGMWTWNRGHSPGVLPPAAALQKELGLPVRVLWHWWHGCPYDIGFPEYLPPREGTEPFKAAVAKAHEDGVRMLVYMNQRAWGLSTKSWKEEGAEQFAVKGADGRIRPEVYNTFTKQALVSMCMATPFWRNKYAGIAEEAFDDLGVDGIYMDQACIQPRCYDPNHGHPRGGGDSWLKGFQSLTEDLRRRCDGDRPIVLAGEGCGEAWLPYLDLMLTLELSCERYRALNDPWEVIPFFQAVYHPYATTFGNYSSLSMPPYDELWPAEFAPAEPLAPLDSKFSRQFRLEQARAFVWGHQPTLANFLPSHFETRPGELAFAMKLARIRRLAGAYLAKGEFLRPPKLDIPLVDSAFSRLSIYAGQGSRLTSYEKSHPAVLAGAWRGADGGVAIALANVTENRVSFKMPLDTRYYGISPRPKVFQIDESGRSPIAPAPDPATEPLTMELAPEGACVIEFTPFP